MKTIHDVLVDNVYLLRQVRDSILMKCTTNTCCKEICDSIINSHIYAALAQEYFNEYVSEYAVNLYCYDMVIDMVILDYILGQIQDHDIFHKKIISEMLQHKGE